MRTTIDVDETILREIIEESGEKSLTKAVNKVFTEYLRERRKERLLASLGNRNLDLDDWYEFRHSERT
jgi:Arc/MetJ family transcription regulator